MKTFEEIQEQGSQKYGLLWLETNQIVTECATFYGLDVTQEPMKTALSAVCLGFLNRILVYKVLNETAEMMKVVTSMWLGIYNVINGSGRFTVEEMKSITDFVDEQIGILRKIQTKWHDHATDRRATRIDGKV